MLYSRDAEQVTLKRLRGSYRACPMVREHRGTGTTADYIELPRRATSQDGTRGEQGNG